MLGCVKCGHWHLDAEETVGRRLSCTEVREFWVKIKEKHRKLYGHRAQPTTDEFGNWICFVCGRKLGVKRKEGE